MIIEHFFFTSVLYVLLVGISALLESVVAKWTSRHAFFVDDGSIDGLPHVSGGSGLLMPVVIGVVSKCAKLFRAVCAEKLENK